MALGRINRNAGLLLAGVWFLLTGLATFVALPLPGALMGALALIAGVLLLLGI
jgi:hypothetical protein